MEDDVKKLVEAFTDQNMTTEGQASVLGYARGRLDAQRELIRHGETLAGDETKICGIAAEGGV